MCMNIQCSMFIPFFFFKYAFSNVGHRCGDQFTIQINEMHIFVIVNRLAMSPRGGDNNGGWSLRCNG